MSETLTARSFLKGLIAAWGASDTEAPLYEYLTLTKEEFNLWMNGKLTDEQVKTIYEERN